MLSVGRFFVRPVSKPVDVPPAPPAPPAPVLNKPFVPAPPPVSTHSDEYLKLQKVAPIVGINCRIELVDYCAQVTQIQRYKNNEETALEATYEFELPKGCAVSSFNADIGSRHLTGKIENKQKAEDKYDDALAAGHSAALLEQKEEDPNTFFLQLGNVAPGEEAFVTITYEQLATVNEDKIVMTLNGNDTKDIIFADPPAKTPENDARVQPGFNFAVHVSTQSPLKSVSSPSHPIKVELGEGGATVKLAEDADWRENKSFVLEATVADPHLPSVRIQKVKDSYMAMLSFYPKIETPQTKCEMIFVLDRSGSMSGRAIECAKSTLQFFLRSLPEDAYFNILSFGSRFERFSPESVPFNDDNLESATKHVNEFKANLGGTNIYDPLDSIFKQATKPGYPRQVFILTDGEVNDKQRCIELVRENVSSTRLFAFGIGGAVDKDLVNGMARAGEGSSSIVRDTSTIRENVMKQLDRALQPGLTNIEVKWSDATSGKPLADEMKIRQTPLNPPPIFRGTRLVSFALLPEKCPKCKVTLTGSFGDSEYKSEIVVDPESSEKVDGEQIMKLGVRSLIEDIQNGCGGIAKSKNDEIKKAVTELSMKFEVLSKFTAFVGICDGGEPLEASMVTRNVSRNLPFNSMPLLGCCAPPPMFSMAFGCAPGCPAPMAPGMMGPMCAPPPMAPGCPAPMVAYESCPAPKPKMACRSAPRMASRPAPKMAADEFVCYECEAAPAMKCAKPSVVAPPVKKLEKSLDNIILQQKASGCFNALAWELLDIPESAKNAMPKDRPDGVDDKLAGDVWTTLLVLIGLEKKFGNKKSEWYVLANKSEKWVKAKLGSSYEAWRAAAESISF